MRYHAKKAYNEKAAVRTTSPPLLLENGGATQRNAGGGNDYQQFGVIDSRAAFPAGSGNAPTRYASLAQGRAEGFVYASTMRSQEENARLEAHKRAERAQAFSTPRDAGGGKQTTHMAMTPRDNMFVDQIVKGVSSKLKTHMDDPVSAFSFA